MAATPRLEPLHVDAAPGTGRRLYLHHAPADAAPSALMLYVHPFAEEMNKARRMAALQSRALAADGWAVLQLDLHGCGDSDGELGDTSWSTWVDDVERAAAWLRARHARADGSAPPLWLWGLRTGALLAGATLPRLADVAGLLLWQPTLQGKAALQQFLRLKTAGRVASGQGGAGMAELRQTLASGGALEIAGYTLPSALALGLEQATLRPPAPACPVAWIKPVGDDGAMTPAAQAAIARWREAGCAVHAEAAAGPAFWQTTEIEDAPDWLARTHAALRAARTAVPAAAGVAA